MRATPPRCPESWWIGLSREDFAVKVSERMPTWRAQLKTPGTGMTDALRYSWEAGLVPARKLEWTNR